MHLLKNKKGGTLVLFAVSLIVLLGFAGLGLDITHLYNVKTQLQLAADSAALAGANELNGTSPSDMILHAKEAAYEIGIQVGRENEADGQMVTLDKNLDIEVGIWEKDPDNPDPNKYRFRVADTGDVNAVRVHARRTGANDDQPPISNWFMDVLSVIGFGGNDTSGVSATAIACRQKLSLVPLAVNEYWNGSYPQSYMRSTNVDGTPSLKGGQIFAITGSGANNNNNPSNPNGYINVFWRNDKYSGNGNWYEFREGGPGDCSDCGTMFPPESGIPNTGTVNNIRFGEYFYYLFMGLDDSIVPPLPVLEPYNPAYNSDITTQAGVYSPLERFACTYATVSYFNVGGTITIQPQGPLNLSFYEKWPKGARFLVMVYDGVISQSGSYPDVVTVVGYGIIEVNGYLNRPFRGDPSEFDVRAVRGNTCYGHAVKHGLAGERDEYLIENTSGNCVDFMNKLAIAQKKFAPVRLVDPDLNYGVASH